MWPQWSAELRELYFDSVTPQSDFGWLHRPFRNLVKFKLRQQNFLDDFQIAEVVKYNPQLKEFKLVYSSNIRNVTPEGIFQSIVENVPHIESISISLNFGWLRENQRNIPRTYLGQLSKLTNLELQLTANWQNFAR